ncbi:hypothetical protein NQZ68_000664 [Dissostichus eleginoides]|nr:hypothetical protein NQZ68_000664 [Dissostichus eleginoides]
MQSGAKTLSAGGGASLCCLLLLWLIYSHLLREGQLAVGTCEIVMLNRDSSVPRRTIARQTARCACRRGQIAGTTRARPACVEERSPTAGVTLPPHTAFNQHCRRLSEKEDRQSYIRQAVCLHEDSLWSLLLRVSSGSAVLCWAGPGLALCVGGQMVQNHSPAGTLAADKPGPGPWVSQQGRQQDGATQVSNQTDRRPLPLSTTTASFPLFQFSDRVAWFHNVLPLGESRGRRSSGPGQVRRELITFQSRIVRSRQWCEMAPCLEGEVCSLLFNRSGWTCTRGSGRIKTVTQEMTGRSEQERLLSSSSAALGSCVTFHARIPHRALIFPDSTLRLQRGEKRGIGIEGRAESQTLANLCASV